MIGSGSDQKGLPAYGPYTILLIIHELLHEDVNPRIRKHWDHIDTASQKIFSHCKNDMRKLAYGNAETTMVEWLDNLFTIMYFRENRILELNEDDLINNLQNAGYIWMRRSVDFMIYFYDNRSEYKTINEFMPQIISFINYTANNYEHILAEYNNRFPYVVETYPVSGSNINQKIDKIIIRFSEPMSSSHGMDSIDDDAIIFLPYLDRPFWRDEYTFIVKPDWSEINNGEIYGFKLPVKPFRSEKLYPMKEDFDYFIHINKNIQD